MSAPSDSPLGGAARAEGGERLADRLAALVNTAGTRVPEEALAERVDELARGLSSLREGQPAHAAADVLQDEVSATRRDIGDLAVGFESLEGQLAELREQLGRVEEGLQRKVDEAALALAETMVTLLTGARPVPPPPPPAAEEPAVAAGEEPPQAETPPSARPDESALEPYDEDDQPRPPSPPPAAPGLVSGPPAPVGSPPRPRGDTVRARRGLFGRH